LTESKEFQNYGAEVLPDERKYFSEFSWFKHPIRSYFGWIKNSIIPEKYSHQVKMNINIKTGQREGIALIPCTIYAMDHGIDLNPALILKKDKKMVGYFPPNKKIEYIEDETLNESPFYHKEGNIITYNPVHIVIQTTPEENDKGFKMVEYEEFQRCEKCKQKLVISEVNQTRYRSCPSIKVKLGDPAKTDTVVPVHFGVNKKDVIAAYWVYPMLLILIGVLSLDLMGFEVLSMIGNGFASVISPFVAGSQFPSAVGDILSKILIGLLLAFFWILWVPRLVFKGYSMIKWHQQVKKYLVKNKDWSV